MTSVVGFEFGLGKEKTKFEESPRGNEKVGEGGRGGERSRRRGKGGETRGR